MENRKVGRPTNYTTELAHKICDLIATDGRSIDELAEQIDWFPCSSVFYDWLLKHPEFSELHSRAKLAQIEIRLEYAQKWINDASQDYREDSKGRLVANNMAAQRLRAHVNFNQWRASKLMSNKYGDKTLDDKAERIERDIEVMKAAIVKNRDEL